MSRNIIRADRLRHSRKRHNLSQEQLRKVSKLSAKTISNLERGHQSQSRHFVNNHTLEHLRTALRTTTEILSGKDPLPEQKPMGHISEKLSSQVSLNYDLVCSYFEITRQEILDIAPLLFFIAAEKSRDFQITAIRQMIKDGAEIYENNSDIEIDEHEWDDLVDKKVEAYQKKDLFETSITANEISADDNPFTNYLRNKVLKPRFKNQIALGNVDVCLFGEFTTYSFSTVIPDYLVCTDLLEQITLGSEKARKSLLNGTVAISEIPRSLFGPKNSSERVQWLEDALDTYQSVSDGTKGKKNGN